MSLSRIKGKTWTTAGSAQPTTTQRHPPCGAACTVRSLIIKWLQANTTEHQMFVDSMHIKPDNHTVSHHFVSHHSFSLALCPWSPFSFWGEIVFCFVTKQVTYSFHQSSSFTWHKRWGSISVAYCHGWSWVSSQPASLVLVMWDVSFIYVKSICGKLAGFHAGLSETRPWFPL